MTVLLTGCSSQEILSEVPQTIVLPEEQIDSLPMQEEDPTSAETENTESFSLLEEGGSRFAYESLEAPEQIWYLEIEQALGEMEGTDVYKRQECECHKESICVKERSQIVKCIRFVLG